MGEQADIANQAEMLEPVQIVNRVSQHSVTARKCWDDCGQCPVPIWKQARVGGGMHHYDDNAPGVDLLTNELVELAEVVEGIVKLENQRIKTKISNLRRQLFEPVLILARPP